MTTTKEYAMPAQAIATRYLAALEGAVADRIIALFTPDATVHSPLYGVQPACAYYPELLKTTSSSQTEVQNVLATPGGDVAAIHFLYDWTLADGKVVRFECVDVLTLSPDATNIAELRIIYDTAPLRADFEKVLAEVR